MLVRISKLASLLLTFSLLVAFSESYKSYMKKIPNANLVKNPCNSDKEWNGVGHYKPGGGGLRNPFGSDFAKHKMVRRVAVLMRRESRAGRLYLSYCKAKVF